MEKLVALGLCKAIGVRLTSTFSLATHSLIQF